MPDLLRKGIPGEPGCILPIPHQRAGIKNERGIRPEHPCKVSLDGCVRFEVELPGWIISRLTRWAGAGE